MVNKTELLLGTNEQKVTVFKTPKAKSEHWPVIKNDKEQFYVQKLSFHT